MKSALVISSLAVAAAAAADPQITPRAALEPRQQNSDPAFLGWVSASQMFSDNRSCDFPATVSRSGSLAQCCSGNSCVFWSSCSAGTLFASQTSLFCDQGYCNTAVLVPTIGAKSGQSYLGCWATSLGQSPFTIVADIGSAPASAPATVSSTRASSGSAPRTTSGASSAAASQTTSSGGSQVSSASPSAQSSGAAQVAAVQPLTGVFGLVAMFLGML